MLFVPEGSTIVSSLVGTQIVDACVTAGNDASMAATTPAAAATPRSDAREGLLPWMRAISDATT
ncbi:hypothetical protein [Pyramidobacter sp. CG50-2]|uniref:hypothetical protein n=1 Tax=Pyramidobacter sp. CG50-2 TaxID=2382160 RepID=UPI001F37DCEE|nr:hypothetical protein [Pyramidobacter sp. CG50-2]